ncbi:HAD family hydrolase [Simiduia curdlanivorans]|uniref:phosphoglycolate phosphatase n=1 Tax=Simiduia curdlanivorans TaxID=1492769 RepID=A0ABV8V9A9_9GAMM|nr:HAD family hydrolase [Simiduia curdlanivorans]MDN3639118.1 HAD family hydrolase [Simiduia curdlanivorans]
MQRLNGIIFDLDGTLADSQLNFTAICDELAIPHQTPLLEYQQSLSCPHAVARVQSVIEKHEMAGAACATWIADAEAVLNKLAAAKVPMAIVTRNMRKATQLTVQKLKIPIELIITREDCQAVKPHPEALLSIAQQWQIPTQQLAYVGDYKFDLEAAQRAGMRAILWRNHSNAHFIAQADHAIERFEELFNYLDQASI